MLVTFVCLQNNGQRFVNKFNVIKRLSVVPWEVQKDVYLEYSAVILIK